MQNSENIELWDLNGEIREKSQNLYLNAEFRKKS